MCLEPAGYDRSGRQPDHNASQLLEVCQYLIRQLCAAARHSRQTPLLDSSERLRAVARALHAACAELPPEPRIVLQHWDQVEETFRSIVDRALGDPASAADQRHDHPNAAPAVRGSAEPPEPTSGQWIPWLERLAMTLLDVDPLAADILELRLDDLSDREIADRLVLGTRLVRHIRQTTWKACRWTDEQE